MLDNNLIKFALLFAAVSILAYMLSQQGVIHNDGPLDMGEASGGDGGTPTPQRLWQYEQQDTNETMPPMQTDEVINPQVDDMLNDPRPDVSAQRKQVRFAHESECPNMNITVQNKSVLPPPQNSNNYTPLNNFGTSADNNIGGDVGPQTVENIKTRCQPAFNCYPKDTVTSAELLPREDPYNMWSQVNPDTPGHLADKNFLESGHHFGINTVGSSLRNANQQLRSDPPIPQIPVGPWQQSTIDPDTNRRQFDIGCDW